MSRPRNHSRVSEEQADSRLIEHYQSQSISTDRLHVMLEETQSSHKGRAISFALAASLLLFFLVVLTHQSVISAHRTDNVMREAALNHSSKLKMDAQAGTLEELQGQLVELPFEIKMPESGFYSKLAVIGGRYCTINGYLAAHLKLADPESSKQYSLFLTPSKDRDLPMKSSEAVLSGVDVKLWHEDDVVYAFAENTSDAL